MIKILKSRNSGPTLGYYYNSPNFEIIKPAPDFREFQDLPEIVRNALVYGMQDQSYPGHKVDEGVAVTFMVDHYINNYNSLAIGEYVDLFERFNRDKMKHSMVRCYVDNGCNMVAAKLAWHEDYPC